MPAQRGSSTTVKPDPAGAPFKPGTKAYDTAVAKAKAQRETKAAGAAYWSLQAHGLAPPTDVPVRNAQPKQTGSTLGLTDPNAPWQGVAKGKTPAKTKATPHLSEQSALAKARLERIQHGGLLTPAQRAAEALASASVPTRAAFATPPPEAKAPAKGLPRATSDSRVAPNPRAGMAAAEAKLPKGQIAKVDVPSYDQFVGSVVDQWLGAAGIGHRSLPSNIYRAITGQSNSLTTPQRIVGTTEAFGQLKPSVGEVPGSVTVAQADLTPGARKMLQQAGIKGDVPLKALIDQYGNGALGPRFRKQLIDMAKKGGHHTQDASTWSDADAAARAFNPYKHTPFGFLQNFAADTGSLMSLPQIVPALVSGSYAAAQGNTQPLARTAGSFLDQWRKHLAFVGDRPFFENLYNQPITTATSNAPIAKWAGVRLGKGFGLEKTREVTLPTTSREGAPHAVTVPATQNVFTRPLTRVSDAVLARSEHPDVRRQGAPPTNPLAELFGGLPGKAGHALEKRHATKSAERNTALATLARSSEARAAQARMLKAVRKLPTQGADLLGRSKKVESEGGKLRKVSSKQQRAETIVKHSGIGMSSTEAARYYDTQAGRTQALIDEAKTALADAHAREAEARAGSDAEAAQKAAQDVADSTSEIEKLTRVHASQVREAAYSRANPVDIHNLSPAEREVADAWRHASQVTSKLKGERGAIGEAGTLYGDLQHNLEIEATLHPDTQAGKMARVVLGHRDIIDTLEKTMSSLADRRSPAAQQSLGKLRVLTAALNDISGRRAAVAARAEHAIKPGAAETAAQQAGVAKGTLHRITQEGRSALTAKRERHSIRVRAEEKIANEMETSQRSAHETVATRDLRAKQMQLNNAQHRTNSPIEKVAERGRQEVERLTPVVSSLQARLDKGFQPDERLIAQRAKVERMKAENSAIELSPGQASAIAHRHISAAQEKAIGATTLHDAIHENQRVGADRELARQEARLQAQHGEATRAFEDVSGSKADAALRHEESSRAFVQGMKLFQEHQRTQGIDPFHISLHRPGDRTGSVKTEKTRYSQFPEGNYTHDIHIQISADLEANARAAVEADLFKRVSTEPYVVHDPPTNSRIPPGFILTDAEALKTPRKPEYGTEGNQDLMDSWGDEVRKPHEYVPDDGKHYVLVSRDMQDWLHSYVRGNQIDLGRFQAALKFTNAYRRWMLFTLPRTLINNAVGNPILAAIGGAGIVDYIRAIHILRNHPEFIPVTMRHAGPIANVLETQKLTGYQNFWRNANVFHEDLGRLTTYMHHVVRAAKKDQGLKFYNRIDMASSEMTNFLKDMASGKNPDVLKFTDFATQWFGNMAKKGKWDPVLSTGFLFHRWVGHMIHLTLWTMPTKYPGRTAFLLNVSHMADAYRKEHGNLPDWAKSIVGLWSTVDTVAGAPQRVLWGANTGGANPFATPGQTLDFGSTANTKLPLASILAANLNPALRVLIEQSVGRRLDTLDTFKDTYGRALSPFDWRLFAQQVIANTPILATLFPRTGMADNAIQVDPNAPRRYSAAGLRDPSYYPPTPIGHGFLLDIAERALASTGLSIRPIDSTGPRTKLSAQKAVQAIYTQAQKDSQAIAAGHAAANKRISQQARKP